METAAALNLPSLRPNGRLQRDQEYVTAARDQADFLRQAGLLQEQLRDPNA